MNRIAQPRRVAVLIETMEPIRPGAEVPTRIAVSDGRIFTDRIEFPKDSPPHRLRMAGYVVKRLPADSAQRRRPCLSLPVAGRGQIVGQIVVALAEAELGLENAAAVATWAERGLLSCTIRLEPHRWVGDDADAAVGALRWLERLSGHTFPGGRRKGSIKGRRWVRAHYIAWYREAGQAYAGDGQPLTLKHLGEAMGVSADTARERLRHDDVNLPWPPETDLEAWDPDA